MRRSLERILGTTQRLRASLGVRVAVFLGVALLPVGMIAVWQTLQVGEVARQRSDLTLLAVTERAAMAERQAIQRALGTAQALSTAAGTFMAAGACDEELRKIVERGAARFSHAGYVNATGTVVCSSDGQHHDFSGFEDLGEAIGDPRPRVTINHKGPLSDDSLVIASHPVAAEDGGGFTYVSLPHGRLGRTELVPGIARSVELLTFNDRGEVLTSSEGLDAAEAQLPADSDLIGRANRPPGVTIGRDRMGRQRAFAVVPIIAGSVYVLGSWQDTGAFTSPLATGLPPWLFPILMWAISLIVAYVAVHRLVIRHMRDLGRRMRAFAETRTIPEVAFDADAPVEIADMETDFAAMAERILREEAEIENRLHEQKVLLREVHHRVKNNLQLISSIINMQMRQLDSADAQLVLRRIQDRVLGLAAIHRNLYQTDVGTIRADVVLREISGQLARLGPHADGTAQIDHDLDPIELYPDQAVPLSLFVTEAATNAIKYLGRPLDGSPPWISLSLKRMEDGSVRASIANSRGEFVREAALTEDGTGLGNQLIGAFAMQLEAAPLVEETAEAYRLTIRFVPSGLAGDDAADEHPAGPLEAAA